MFHTRVRPLNTRNTHPKQNLNNNLCQGPVVALRKALLA